ncbi:MAG: thermonuclease family protein [Candidatus Omnitrophota bacterium]
MNLFKDKYITTVILITLITILLIWGARFTLTLKEKPVRPDKPDSTPHTKEKPGPELSYIKRVIDADTIVLSGGETVRLIGIDAPETNHPELPVQRFGQEAKDFMIKNFQGLPCVLEYEPENVRDKYGRLLAYVFSNNVLINAKLIERGYAWAYTRFPFKRMDEFIYLEQSARHNQYGLWNFSLRDGRITNLIKKYESLSIAGKEKLDEVMEELGRQYPAQNKPDNE